MRWWSQLMFYARSLFGKRGMDAQLAEEVRTHVEMATEANLAKGMSLRAARRAALREFGNVVGVQERTRDERGWVWLELAWADVIGAVRSLRRDPQFSAVVIATLALGIGATTAITSVVDRVIFNPVPGPDADRIVRLGQLVNRPQQPNDLRSGLSPPVLQILTENRAAFDDLTWCEAIALPDQIDGFIENIYGTRVPPGFFAFFRTSPLLGRTFRKDEAQLFNYGQDLSDSAIILSYGWWQSRFAGDPDIVGQSVRIGDRTLHVVGVMPDHFRFPGASTRFWLPSQPHPVDLNLTAAIQGFAKLAPNTTAAQLIPLLDTLATRLQQDEAGLATYQRIWDRDGGLRLWILSFKDLMRGELNLSNPRSGISILVGLLAAVGLVLLIVCANITHLTLARTERRRGELAMRAALGAKRGRLVRQLLTESTLLALTGGSAGLLFASWGLKLLTAMSRLPQLQPIGLDGRTLIITGAISGLTVICFGLMPAWQGGRVSIEEHLKNSGNTATASIRSRRQSNLLVALEVALAVVLLCGAGLLIRSVNKLLTADPGLDAEHLLLTKVFYYGPTSATLSWNEQVAQSKLRARRALEELAVLPGVEAIGSYQPYGGLHELAIGDGQRTVLGLTAFATVGEIDFFRAARVPLLAGRLLESNDIGEGKSTVVINESMARGGWPGQSALGQTFTTANGQTPSTFVVVGVVADFYFYGVEGGDAYPQYFRPVEDAPPYALEHNLVLRADRDPRMLASGVRATLGAIAPDLQRPMIETISDLMFNATEVRRTFRNYLTVFGVAGLVLAALGVHSVLAYSVARRTREIGIRMALGADRRRIMHLIVGEGGRVIVAGLVIGVLGALALGRFLQGQLYGISPSDPWTIGSVIALLSAVAFAACLLPARRATRVNPMQALRTD